MTKNDGFAIFGQPVRGRSCGSCKACCTQVPVDLPTGHKDANERCQHVCGKGCAIYQTRPEPCRWWSCRWLFDPTATTLKRPDIGGYVVDCMPDTVMANGTPASVLQVWVDPNRRDAHRDPGLRAYLEDMALRHQMAAIIRYSSSEGFVLVAPCLNPEGEWLEIDGEIRTQAELNQLVREARSVNNPISTQSSVATDVATKKI